MAAAVIAAVALLLSLPALAAPLDRRPERGRALDRFAHAVGTAVTWVLMTVLYYLLFLPVGLLLRARGKLGDHPRLRSAPAAYWTSVDRPGRGRRTPESYRRQF